MSSNEQLMRRYPDLIAPDSDSNLVRIVHELDAAGAAAARALQPPAALVDTIERMIDEQRAEDRHIGQPIPGNATGVRTQTPPQPPPSIDAVRNERGWLRQWAELAAAIVAFLVVAGVLVTVFRDERDDSAGTQAPPLTSPTASAIAGSPNSVAPSTSPYPGDSILTADDALTRARELLGQVAGGGADEARVISVRLTYLSSIAPKANWISTVGDGVNGAPDTPIWEIEADGLDAEPNCDTATNTIDCRGSQVVIVLDAQTGMEIGMRHPDAGITRRTPSDDIPAVAASAQYGTIELAIRHSIELQLGQWSGGQTTRVVGIWLIRAADFPISAATISSDDPVWLLLIEDDCPFDDCEVRHLVVVLNPMDGMPVVQGSGGAETRGDSLALRDPRAVEQTAISLVPGKDGQPAWAIEASTRFMTISDVWDNPSDYPGLDPWALIWRVELADAVFIAGCPSDASGQSSCTFDHVIVILDAASGALLGIEGDTTPVPPATPTPGVTPSPSPPGEPVVMLRTVDDALAHAYVSSDLAYLLEQPLDGQPGRIVRVELMRLGDALGDGDWASQDSTRQDDADDLIWEIEVANIWKAHSCPVGSAPEACHWQHLIYVFHAATGEIIGLRYPGWALTDTPGDEPPTVPASAQLPAIEDAISRVHDLVPGLNGQPARIIGVWLLTPEEADLGAGWDEKTPIWQVEVLDGARIPVPCLGMAGVETNCPADHMTLDLHAISGDILGYRYGGPDATAVP